METLTAEMDQPTVLPLEIVELELALRHEDLLEKGLEGAVRQALDRIGGKLLFHMRMDGVADCDWVAAVALYSDEGRKVAIVAQSPGGGPLRVEDAETSELPVARIARAYADLMQQLDGDDR
ncbi:hypothetical protein [Nitratireductor thuwali]|uniref:Uncharacterized protein n=1 Tax=Nitratireductor thuwali TaxID=2267699 RepID=A0ABY5MSH8_9HYPH|nr:hypothetical protein NTH_03305 [Nitratireductor thuwali]